MSRSGFGPHQIVGDRDGWATEAERLVARAVLPCLSLPSANPINHETWCNRHVGTRSRRKRGAARRKRGAGSRFAPRIQFIWWHSLEASCGAKAQMAQNRGPLTPPAARAQRGCRARRGPLDPVRSRDREVSDVRVSQRRDVNACTSRPGRTEATEAFSLGTGIAGQNRTIG
jgi:hypothetical protein